MGSQRQRGKGKGGGLEKKPMRGRKPREKGLERGGFICLTMLSSKEFLDPSMYHPVIMVVVPYREEYNSIALPSDYRLV